MVQALVTLLVHSVLGSTPGTAHSTLLSLGVTEWRYSFLVADHVYVSSIAPKSAANLEPVQHVFSSSADESSFEVYPDPRGNILGRGTEITLVLKDDATEFLDTHTLQELV